MSTCFSIFFPNPGEGGGREAPGRPEAGRRGRGKRGDLKGSALPGGRRGPGTTGWNGIKKRKRPRSLSGLFRPEGGAAVFQDGIRRLFQAGPDPFYTRERYGLPKKRRFRGIYGHARALPSAKSNVNRDIIRLSPQRSRPAPFWTARGSVPARTSADPCRRARGRSCGRRPDPAARARP